MLNLWRKLIKDQDIKIKQSKIDYIKKLLYNHNDLNFNKIYEEYKQDSEHEKCKIGLQNFLYSIGYSNEATLSQRQILAIDKYLNIIQKNSIKKLCDKLGKSLKGNLNDKKANYLNTGKADKFIKEQIAGIMLGRDLENLLPSELALLDDPDFIIFDLKFSENRLFCFEKEGCVDDDKTESDTKQNISKGPIIICIDTSGSMHGEPENIAKAIAFYMTISALKEKRPIYMVNFGIKTKDIGLSLTNNLAPLADFLSHSFRGGTDVEPALLQACNLIKSEDSFKNSDVLVISDMCFGKININKTGIKKNKFYSLAIISEYTPIKDPFFDEFYHYNIKQQQDTICPIL